MMEASEALGTQTGDAGQGDGGLAAESGQGPDLSPVLDRFEQLQSHFSDFSDRFDAIEARLPQQEHGDLGQGESELWYNEQLGRLEDAAGNPIDMNQQQQGPDPRFMGAMQGWMQQQIAPLVNELHSLREDAQDRQAADLEGRYPAFQETEYADKIVTRAEQLAEQYGKPELARNVGFIELLHLAEVGQQKATEQQTAAGASETGVVLETGAVTPGGQQGDLESHIDGVIAARQKSTSFFS